LANVQPMNLQPTFSRIIIRPESEHAPKKLIIPEAFKKHANLGEVLAVGPGRRHIDGTVYASPIKAGDRVLFDAQRALKFEFEGEAVVILEDDAVLAVIVGGVEGN
jgi:chaperonin GroES